MFLILCTILDSPREHTCSKTSAPTPYAFGNISFGEAEQHQHCALSPKAYFHSRTLSCHDTSTALPFFISFSSTILIGKHLPKVFKDSKERTYQCSPQSRPVWLSTRCLALSTQDCFPGQSSRREKPSLWQSIRAECGVQHFQHPVSQIILLLKWLLHQELGLFK